MQSDWIVELGPGAGKLGGKIIAEGCPDVFSDLDTPTGKLFKSSQTSNSRSANTRNFKSKLSYNHYSNGRGLEIIGAKENNLKDLNLTIPSNQFVVVTGPSGSGKSSLAFDVVFAEGQRRFMESMSSYARQFVEQVGKPKVDLIKSISPTVAIEQRVTRDRKNQPLALLRKLLSILGYCTHERAFSAVRKTGSLWFLLLRRKFAKPFSKKGKGKRK